MGKQRLILTRRWPQRVEARLGERFELVPNTSDEPFSQAQLRDALREADALGATVTDTLDAGVLDVPNVRARIIGNFGVGFNHIDLDAAGRAGLVVTNTPGVLTDATADIAILLMLMVARRAGEGERMLRDQRWVGWAPTSLVGARVSGAHLGIIGMGRIGQAVAARARSGFGMQVTYTSRNRLDRAAEQALGVRHGSLEEVLAADFVSMHCPSNADTHHLLDASRIALMRPGAFLINTARGDVVDTSALVDALREGRIGGAGLDVYEDEPNVPEALRALENVVLLPHLGSADAATRDAMGMCVHDNLVAYFAGEAPPNRVV